jgi:transcription initiation factor TFIIH subunit 4
MVTAQITRDSIRRALSNGILADQIITYLSVHAHRQMRRVGSENVLPTTVVDQIKLWQLEMDRVRSTEGYLYTDFRDQKEYETIAGFAEELGVLIWQNQSRRKFFVTREGNSQVIDFVNRRMRA